MSGTNFIQMPDTSDDEDESVIERENNDRNPSLKIKNDDKNSSFN